MGTVGVVQLLADQRYTIVLTNASAIALLGSGNESALPALSAGLTRVYVADGVST
jgi:hypothetical protein